MGCTTCEGLEVPGLRGLERVREPRTVIWAGPFLRMDFAESPDCARTMAALMLSVSVARLSEFSSRRVVGR